MSKAVLLSIAPRWCELIASGKKTVEVRKTRPKIEPPFKCYIYETKGKTETPTFVDEDGHEIYQGRGQVIGEFVCDFVDYVRNYGDCVDAYDCKASCLTAKEIIEYATDAQGHFVYTYGWHISDLVIYDEPKKLREFNGRKLVWRGNNHIHAYEQMKRPPQSWCYVEEVSDDA